MLKSALVNFTIESLSDWGTCFATASVSHVIPMFNMNNYGMSLNVIMSLTYSAHLTTCCIFMCYLCNFYHYFIVATAFCQLANKQICYVMLCFVSEHCETSQLSINIVTCHDFHILDTKLGM